MNHSISEKYTCASNSGTEQGPGKLYILNHKNFDEFNRLNGDKDFILPERDGTDYDVESLQKTFNNYDVQNITYNDLTHNEIDEKMKEISTTNFSNNSCIIIAILTHGFKDNALAARDKIYNLNDNILKISTNIHLKSKPKIFLVQACRGDNDLFQINLCNLKTNGSGLDDLCTQEQPYYYCDEKYVLHSTTEAFVAYLHDNLGSPFIQKFCEYMNKFGSYRPITEIFPLVMKEVQELSRIQMPEIKTNAIKHYVFGDYSQRVKALALPVSSTTNYGNNPENIEIGFRKGKKPGVLHIFNHSQFNGNLKLEERKGTELDVKELKQTFEIYGVATFTHNNLTLRKIRRKIEKISTTDFSENSYIVVVFLTHGFRNNIIAAKDKLYRFNEMILRIQSNETLISKPKIYLIQASLIQGSLNRLYSYYEAMKSEPVHLTETYVNRCSADLIPSFRVETKGTPFIQLFCAVLKKNGFDRTIGEIFDLVMITVQNQIKQSPEIMRKTVHPFGDYCKQLDATDNHLSEYSAGVSNSIYETEKPNERFNKFTEVNRSDNNSNVQNLSELELSDDNDDDYTLPIKKIIQNVSKVIEFPQKNDRLTINEKAEQFIAKFKSEDVEKWVQVCPCGRSPIPENPVIGGYDIDGHPIYIGRAILFHELLPAKVSLERKNAFVSYDSREHKTTDFEVLTGTGFNWVPAARGSVPSNAVRGGTTRDGEILYIGRTVHDTTITPGKIHPSHGFLYIPFDGLEIRFFNYDVLVKTN